LIFDGYIFLSTDRSVPFHFENGYLELFLGNSPFSFEDNTTTLIGQKRSMMTGGYILFHLSTPIQNFGVAHKRIDGEIKKIPISIGTRRMAVNFYIDKYEEKTIYTKLKFSFSELDYFIPSSGICNFDLEEKRLEFMGSPIVLKSFTFEYRGRIVSFSLVISSAYNLGKKSIAETESHLILEFDGTDDLEFLGALYFLIHNLFSFLCNRQNIGINSVNLRGKNFLKTKIGSEEDGVLVDKEIPISSTFFVLNKYKDAPEDLKIIKETIPFNILEPSFENLFSLFLENKISVKSIHSSIKARSLLDLKQSLHISAAFEYYQRTYLPEISSAETIQVIQEVRTLIEEYASTKTGEMKKKARSLLRSIRPTVSLEDKICKVYNGYKEWEGLSFILSEYYGDDVSKLAGIANEWRNELAHEKREYTPDIDVFSSVSLLEHLNYCIVLRNAGYSDENIKIIVDKILVH